MTETELARLVRVARSMGHYHVSGTEKEFTCPLDYEANRKEGLRGVGVHRFTVFHLARNSGTSVAEVTAALADHIDPDAEACSRVTVPDHCPGADTRIEIGTQVKIVKGAWKNYSGTVSYMDSRSVQVTVSGFDYPARVVRRSIKKI